MNVFFCRDGLQESNVVTRTFFVDTIELISRSDSDGLIDSMFDTARNGDSSELESIDSYKPKKSMSRPTSGMVVAKKKVHLNCIWKIANSITVFPLPLF